MTEIVMIFLMFQPSYVAYKMIARFINASTGECGLTIGRRLDGNILYRASILLKKGSPYREAFNRG